MSELDQFSDWLAQSKFFPSKRGPKAIAAYDLVNSLDHVLFEYTGKRITRSYKSPTSTYVGAVCRIADPNMGDGTIDGAMKRIIRLRRETKPPR